jgi:hypothetical protein
MSPCSIHQPARYYDGIELPAVGARVDYRFWPQEVAHHGTVQRYWGGAGGESYCDIKREGYREVAVMPLAKMIDPQLVRVWLTDAIAAARVVR